MPGPALPSSFRGIIDTTLREGQQSPLLFDHKKYRFHYEEKRDIVFALIELGITTMELFSPVVSDLEAKELARLKDEARAASPRPLTLLGHCRCHPEDIQRTMDLGFDGLNLYMSASRIAQEHNYRKSFEEIFEIILRTIVDTRDRWPSITLRFSVEDAFRTPMDNITTIYDAIAPYVNTLGMPDTVGIATPDLVRERVSFLKNRYPHHALECHFHNDRGLSVINALTAVQCGAEYIDASVWGLGERSGITSLTGLLFNLHKTDPSVCTRFNLDLCYPLNVLMATLLKTQVPYTECVSLTNRTHIAGVHQKAVLNHHTSYEGNDLAHFGVTTNQLLLGPLSGWNTIYYYTKEILNYRISPAQAKEISTEFKNQADRIHAEHSPEDLLRSIISRYELPHLHLPDAQLRRREEDLDEIPDPAFSPMTATRD